MSKDSLSVLSQPITKLKGVGPKMAENLQKLDIEIVQDLLFHLPLRYQDRTQIHPIGATDHGQEVLIVGEVEHSEIVFRGRRMMICTLSDGTGMLTLRFFHFSKAQQQALSRGSKVSAFGEIRIGKASREMVHPEYKILTNSTNIALTDALTPIYPATKGIQQRSLLRLANQAVSHLNDLKDLIPENISERYKLADLKAALKILHQPTAEIAVLDLQIRNHPAQQRLIFEELLAHHLSLRKLREQQKKGLGFPFYIQSQYFERLKANLPFALTHAQSRVINEINQDLSQSWPMSRLVQGDVGSGKTLVAAAAALSAIESGYQVALMAPTEILAEQHVKSFREWLEPLNLKVSLVSGKLKVADKRQVLEETKKGECHLVIGTHALFQNDVHFQKLGLIIVDEQHRFGVHQRMTLRDKGKASNLPNQSQNDAYPHQLVMTATPIPRTLAMTTYADMDYSVIDELPPGRTPVKTVVISNTRRDEIVQRINAVCADGAQVYWVCTLIEESEALQCQNAEETWELLKNSLPDLTIGMIHGRMKSVEKEVIMADFKSGKINLLVATTVIEVGVDVPNASLMIIENAERLGLAQLHQLRGRVGRGSKASSCVLMYQTPLSQNGKKRLEALRNSNDGFEIAKIDLEIRGPGEVFGTRQTGELQFRIANLMEDQFLLPKVQEAAKLIMEHYPENVEPLIDRWIKHAEDYAAV